MIPAQYFDIIGLFVWIVLFYIGMKVIKEKKLKSYGYILILIAILGMIVDGYIVITNFILK